MDETIHQLTTKFLKTLSQNLGKTNKTNAQPGTEVLSDPTLQIIIHMISCTKMLRDTFEASTGSAAAISASGGLNSVKKPKSSIHFQLYQPMLNGILVLLGKMLMDSFTYEPKVTETDAFSTAYGILGRHVLTLFPEMATKKHKTSGKMLIHHAVFKARPAIAEETVALILKVSPSSGRAEDATGALPLHWATRNPDVSFEVIDLLLKAYPEAPSKADSKGFSPLHWAVNQDAPNVEVVRKLIKIFPAGAGMPSLSGNLPLHYCVARARPSVPVIKALVAAYPEAIRSGCEEGYLPLHRYLYRPIVDLDALRLLINYFPDALLAKSNRNQTPLHVALDHHTPDALAVGLLMEVCPAAISVADSDRYLPLHLCLDCAEPDYSLALQLLLAHPQAASFTTKDGMLPLHLLVGANSDPTHEHRQGSGGGTGAEGEGPSEGGPNAAVTFVTALLNAYPQALGMSVRDIIPAMDGQALADPESWSGEWVETYWTPLSRARDRGLTGLAELFRGYQKTHGIVDPTDSVGFSAVAPAGGSPLPQQPSVPAPVPSSSSSNASPPSRPVAAPQPVADVRFNENNASMESINFNAAKPVKSQPLYSGASNYSGVNPIRVNNNPPRVGARGVGSTASGDEEDVRTFAGHATSGDEGAPVVSRVTRLSKPSGAGAVPTMKIPPHILKAQQQARSSAGGSQSGESRASSRDRGGPEERAQQQAALQQQYQRQQQQGQGQGGPDGAGLFMESVGEMPSFMSTSRDTTPLRQGMVGQGSSLAYNPNASTGSARSLGSAQSRGPPAGPIPASLLQAAENNALRLGKGTGGHPPGLTASQLQAINDAARASRRTHHHSHHGSHGHHGQGAAGGPESPSNQSRNKGSRSPRSPKGNGTGSRSPKGSFNSALPVDTGKIGQSATTGRALPNTTRHNNPSGTVSNNNNSSDDLVHDERIGTAPQLGVKKQWAENQPPVVGFGARSVWSQGEETAESSQGEVRPAPAAATTSAMTAKQQRLLQAQQAYMRRAQSSTAGSAASSAAALAISPDAVPTAVLTNKPAPAPSHAATAPAAINLKSAPSNHTSEILKGMAGKVRIHPLAGSSGGSGANVRVVPVMGQHQQAVGGGNSLDEMV